MQYLLLFIGIIVLIFILFIIKGMLNPSLSYNSEITVDKTTKEAWAVMNDESKISLWLKDITNVEHVSGTKGTVGAVTKYTFNQNGRESTILETIKEVRDNEYINMDFVMKGAMTMDYEMSFSEKGGKTHIKSSTITEGDGIMMKSILSFMKNKMQIQEDENMGNLKEVIEGNTTDYFS